MPRATMRSGRPTWRVRGSPGSPACRPEKAFARLSSLLMRRGYGPEIARSAARKALEIPFGE